MRALGIFHHLSRQPWPLKTKLQMGLFLLSSSLFLPTLLLTHQEQQHLCSSSREVVTSCGGIFNSFVEKVTEKTRNPSGSGEMV